MFGRCIVFRYVNNNNDVYTAQNYVFTRVLQSPHCNTPSIPNFCIPLGYQKPLQKSMIVGNVYWRLLPQMNIFCSYIFFLDGEYVSECHKSRHGSPKYHYNGLCSFLFENIYLMTFTKFMESISDNDDKLTIYIY